jgi:hypothetical protein
VTVHKSTPFTDEEIDGCFDAWQGVETLELIQVQLDSAWRGVELHQPPTGGKGVAEGFPCERGDLPCARRTGRFALDAGKRT